jgi:hypothetical protein
MSSQPLEDMQARYPQLHPYFEIMNANLRIAIVCMDTMIQHHPKLSKKKFKQRGVLNPETAEVSIHRYLPYAMKASPFSRQDVCPITALLEGMTAEADRYPSLQPIVECVVKQAQPYLALIGSAYKPTPSP